SWSNYLTASDRGSYRNEVIAARMYAIDVNYTKFENALNAETQSVEFWTNLVSGSLTIASGVVPVEQTMRWMNAVATGTKGLQAAYSDAFLRKKLMEALITTMRAARHEQRAVIRTRLTCASTIYPFGLAMSDVESYSRAGTIETAIMRLAQTTTA